MSTPPSTEVTLRAPAKLNLGLEVLGRRTDGYHDIATIFLAVDLYDRITARPARSLQLRCSDDRLPSVDNIALLALESLREASGEERGALVELRKHIPAAAGLGGASSDAAAALRAARALWELPVNDEKLASIGAKIGSDVPFFLRGGCALGHGRGELLDPLPIPLDVWFVVVVPPTEIPSKTTTLYGALRPEDFSDGGDVEAQAALLRAGQPLNPAWLKNAFSRALYAIAPDLASLRENMGAAGAPVVAISGAGPAHYSVHGDREEAERLADGLRARLRNRTSVYVVAPSQTRADDQGRYDVS